MKRISKKNLQKLVPFAAAVFALALVTAGCENVMLQKLLRNPNKRAPQAELSKLTIEAAFENQTLAKNLSLAGPFKATPSQITANPNYIDYVVKVPYGTTSAWITEFKPEIAGAPTENFTYSPANKTMALPSKKPVTIKVTDAGGASKTYSVYFVVCPEAYYVAAYGDDRNSGDSKERPFKQLKTALDAASNSRVVNKVVVIGTLTAANAVGFPTNDSHTFNLEGYGLLNDSEPEHAWNKDRSITISGMDGATLKAVDVRGDPNNKGVMKISGNSYLNFENITFTGGNCTQNGGGLYIYQDDGELEVELRNGTRIIGNKTTGDGGGIYVDVDDGEDVKLTITGAEISYNEAGAGGGIYLLATSGATIKESTIEGNIATLGGGAYIDRNDGSTITGCIFSGNTSITGGPVFKTSDSDNLSFSGNTPLGNSPDNELPS